MKEVPSVYFAVGDLKKSNYYILQSRHVDNVIHISEHKKWWWWSSEPSCASTADMKVNTIVMIFAGYKLIYRYRIHITICFIFQWCSFVWVCI